MECSFGVDYVPCVTDEARIKQKIAYVRLADLLIEQRAKELREELGIITQHGDDPRASSDTSRFMGLSAGTGSPVDCPPPSAA